MSCYGLDCCVKLPCGKDSDPETDDPTHELPEPLVPAPKGSQRALLIGINYVGQMGELEGCVNDAKHMRSYLKNKWAFKDDEMLLLIDEDLDPKALTILDKARYAKIRRRSNNVKRLPNLANILGGIAWLIDGAKKGDSLFIHYSGHGGYVADRTNEESDNKDETIIPIDYDTEGHIRDDTLRKVLVNNLPNGVRLFCLFDCCYSGTILDLRYRYKIDESDSNDDYDIFVSNSHPITDAFVVMISGCKDSQVSMDAFEEGKNQGAMTYSFLETVEMLEHQSYDRSFTYWDLIKNLQTFLRDKRYQQIPQISSGKLVDLEEKWTL